MSDGQQMELSQTSIVESMMAYECHLRACTTDKDTIHLHTHTHMHSLHFRMILTSPSSDSLDKYNSTSVTKLRYIGVRFAVERVFEDFSHLATRERQQAWQRQQMTNSDAAWKT